MLRSIPARLFLEWRAYSQIEPFGEWRADLRNAHLVGTYVNSHLKKGVPAKKLSDFMFDFERSEEDRAPRETPEHKVERLKAVGRMIAQAVGGIWRTGKDQPRD